MKYIQMNNRRYNTSSMRLVERLEEATRPISRKEELQRKLFQEKMKRHGSEEVNDTGWVEVPKGTYSLGNTRTAIVDAIFAHCNDHQIDIETIIADLQSKAALTKKEAA